MLTLRAWINTLSTSSPLHRAGQSVYSVLVNTVSKQWETPGVYWSKHLLCKQLTIAVLILSSLTSATTGTCLPWHSWYVLSNSNSELNYCITTAAPAKGTSWGRPGLTHCKSCFAEISWLLSGLPMSFFWKICQSSQLHKQSQSQIWHYFKLEKIVWCRYTWKENGSYFAQRGLWKHVMRGNPYHEKAVKYRRRKLSFLLEVLVYLLLTAAQRLKIDSFQHWRYKSLGL